MHISELSRDKKLELLKYILRNSKRKDKCLVCYIGLERGRSRISLGGKGNVTKYFAPRLIMHLLTGFDIDDLNILVLHNDELCKSKACIEFDHLRLGTHEENMADAQIKYGPIRSRNSTGYCLRGHLKTKDNMAKNGACLTCKKLLRRHSKHEL